MAAQTSKRFPAKRSYAFLISSCLAGVPCAYDGMSRLKPCAKKLVDEGMAVPLCAEVMGGLSVPRDLSEIVGGDGYDVLEKKAKVLTISGKDVSSYYINGAKKILKAAKKYKIKNAILKSKSPACGKGRIYDGTFRGVLKTGDGVLAALLSQNNIRVFSEKEIPRAIRDA